MRLIYIRRLFPAQLAYLGAFASSILGFGGIACARGTPIVSVPVPVSTGERKGTSQPNEVPSPRTVPSVPKTWEFRYTQGGYPYTIITEAEIAQIVVPQDTSKFRALPVLTQTVRIAVSDSGFSVVEPSAPTSFKCDSLASLFSRGRLLLSTFPVPMTVGTSWRDSTTVDGCTGDIPVTSKVVRIFTVIGDTTFNQTPVLLVRRAETIAAKGEGHEGQHRILLAATGNGDANLYLDVTSGRVLGVTSAQQTYLTITTSGRTTQFLQRVRERITLTGTP